MPTLLALCPPTSEKLNAAAIINKEAITSPNFLNKSFIIFSF